MHRRDFLVRAGAAGAMLAFPWPVSAQAPLPPARRDPASIRVDSLASPGFEEFAPGRYRLSASAAQAIRERRIDVLNVTIGEVGNGPDRYRSGVEAVVDLDRIIAAHSDLLMKIERPSDIHTARRAGKLGLIYNFQDTTALEADAAKVASFATLGIRILQLTYNKRNLAGDGCLERSNAGLSDFGREVIAAIEAEKLLLDLSHAGQRTIAEGIAAATRPPAITHSACRDLVDLPRNTFDREMRALADKGGVFGVYLMPFLRLGGQPQREDLIRHLDHAVRVCGEDHVGVGTDQPMLGFTISDESRAAHRRFFEERRQRGIAAPGESADVMNYVEGYNDVARYDRLAADLRGRGWSSARIGKVLGNNWVRLFGEVWKA